MIIKYESAVKTNAGWRSETVTARVELLSPKRAKVIEVIDIGGNGSTGYGSRTGSKRQQYNVGFFASQQIGAIKLTSRIKEILE